MSVNNPTSSTVPLLELEGVSRTYGSGNASLTVLHGINIRIDPGEMVAIVGASGSGKSTLMNILGCLDIPTTGVYRVAGVATRSLDADALSRLRREYFGFVFQRYQLLNDLDALGNVETPAVYAGVPLEQRRNRATMLLTRLGLADRIDHRPTELSGGQQQRVSIARALVNGGHIILADEPTGALDSHSGEELIELLQQLNEQGHTIVVVTHDPDVARHASRIIEIRDGQIISDQPNGAPRPQTITGKSVLPIQHLGEGSSLSLDRFREAFRLALRSAGSHRLRSLLTMLGIVIGIASVACMVARGEGNRQKVLDNLRVFGSGTIDIFPGHTAGDLRASAIHTLSIADTRALEAQPYVDSVTPIVSSSVTVRSTNKAVSVTVIGADVSEFRVNQMEIVKGRRYNEHELDTAAPVAVLDEKSWQTLYGAQSPVGQVLLVGNIPCRVIGVTKQSAIAVAAGTLDVYMPYSSVMSRMTGSYDPQYIRVRPRDGIPPSAALSAITTLLELRHGKKDFVTFSSDMVYAAVQNTSANLTLLVSSIAFISLLVGGVGVMNIMLVSVTERTHEIGIRMALGARRSDIRNQFLIEAVWLCLMGGLIGIAVALVVIRLFADPQDPNYMLLSTNSLAVSFSSSVLVGIVFGYFPARQAAQLSPAEALVRE